MHIRNILIAIPVIVNLWYLLIVLAYSAARSMTQLDSYMAVSKKLLDNCQTTSGYLWWLIKSFLTVPMLFLLIICEYIALFIEKFLIPRRKKPKEVERRKEY